MADSPDDKLPPRKTERLHAGRVSAKGAVYFVTFVTGQRARWLNSDAVREAVLSVLRAWHEEDDGRILAATVMPDHVHVIFEAGDALSVERCVSRWKAQARKACGYAGDWQRDFWEHRVRAGSEVAGWWCACPERFRFTAALGEDGVPPREWLGWDAERFAGLKTGE